jgi:tripartite-type tricarboxylate transporter receptor subunit TctC
VKSKCILTAAILAAALPAAALSQSYPAKPLRIVVPLAPGGNVDLVARALAQRLSESLGQQVIVENRPGASSLVGTQYVAKSAPDGYVILAMANTFAAVPAVLSKPGYDAVKDFTGITQTCRLPQVLVVTPTLPVRSVKDLVALAKARPGELVYASAGLGSTGHFAAELFNKHAGVKMLHVPYKGNAPAIVDVIAGHVMMIYDQVSTSAPHVHAGKLRALAVTVRQPVPLLPGIPTIEQSGVKGYEYFTYNGLMAPAGTPRDVVARLHADAAKALGNPAMREKFQALGVELAASSSPEEFTSYIRKDLASNIQLAKEAGIKLE